MSSTLIAAHPTPTHNSDASVPLNLSHAVLDFLQTTKGVRRLCLELLGTLCDWGGLLHPSASLRALSNASLHAKNFTALGNVPEESVKVAEHVVAAKKNGKNEFGEFANKVSCLLISITDVGSVFYSRGITCVSKTAAKTMGIVGAIALAVTGIHDWAENTNKISATQPVVSHTTKQIEEKQAILNTLGAISDVAYAAIALLGLTTQVVIAPWIPLALSTQSLICALSSQFIPAYTVISTPSK